jgi:selenocysteine lyase/cysteine desulfurase
MGEFKKSVNVLSKRPSLFLYIGILTSLYCFIEAYNYVFKLLFGFSRNGVGDIFQSIIYIMQYIYKHLESYKGIKLYTPYPLLSETAPVLSFNIEGRQSEDTAQALSKKGISVRAGLHCAPCAHKRFGTLESGVVRLAPSFFTTFKEAEYVCRVIKNEIIQK